ncbi:MAG: hypothetical protein AUG74_01215, partial [Bacteroidetes bacterium 13_1_20CM_4_60_6]
NALRGMRLHCQRTDYVIAIEGRVLVGLHDLRPDSASCGTGALYDLHGDAPAALVIPPGVIHGFYMPQRAAHIIGLSHCHGFGDDHLGCRWDDAGLGIAWPCIDPILVERDSDSGSLEGLRAAYAAARTCT